MKFLFDFRTPEFLLAEFPVKTGTPNDNRLFIVHKGVSLIEVISTIDFPEIFLDENTLFREYSYGPEKYILAFHTNNAEFFGLTGEELLDKSWNWFREYLEWEDRNIDRSDYSKNN